MIRALAIACLLIAEALAIYTVAEWVAAAGADRTVPALLFVLAALAAYVVIRFATEWDLPPARASAAIAVTAFVVLYGALRITFAGDLALWDFAWVGAFLDDAEETLRLNPGVVPAAILLIGAWIRGTTRANTEIELELVPRSISLPFIVVTCVVILGAASDRSGEVARGAAAFYAFAVLALAGSQLALSGATFGDLQAGGVVSVLLGATAAITVVAVAAFWVLFGFLGATIGPLLARIVEFVLLIVLTPPAWLLEQLMRALFSNAEFPPLTESLRETISNANAADESEGTSNFERLGGMFLRGLSLLLVLGLVALVIAWYSRLRRRSRAHSEQPPEVAAAGGLAEDVRGLFGRLFARKPAARRASTASEAERLYLDVLARAQRAGLEREQSETPDEFAPRLRGAFRMPVTDDITEAFEEARYGGRPPDRSTIAELERRWREST